jgi:hypothetical protein
MTAFAGAIDAIFADANFGRDGTYHVADGGTTLSIRVVPLTDPPELAGGMVIAAMTNEGRSFLVRRVDYAAVDPRTGDTLEVGDETWRVRAARQRSPLADLWALDCQPAHGTS